MRLLSLLAFAAAATATPLQQRADNPFSAFTHLLESINVTITTETLIDNQVTLNFQVQNPTFIPLTVVAIQSTAGLNGTTLASFTHTFKDFTVQPFSTANSGDISNVTLTQGADASLAFIPDGILDTTSDLNIIAGIIPIPFFPYNQASVPTNYIIEG